MKGCALQKMKAPANKNPLCCLSSLPAAPADSAAGFCHPELSPPALAAKPDTGRTGIEGAGDPLADIRDIGTARDLR
jgi:hypothetical protein